MRRLLSFGCEGAQLGASLDGGGPDGVLIVTGGTQTRVGSHRMFQQLAATLASAGIPTFRFDRRGVGDSEGEDAGFRGNQADLTAAAAAFQSECPGLERIFGLGLCDGASSLALFGKQAGLAGLILINPWLVESEADAPPPAAIKHHYRKRLLSLEGWKKILSGSVSYKKLLKGVLKVASNKASGLADEIVEGLAAGQLPIELILARDDATAVAAGAIWKSARASKGLSGIPTRVTMIETDSHTFARAGDQPALLQAVRSAVDRLRASGSD